MDVIHRYLDCGDLRCGFARIKCDFCGSDIRGCRDLKFLGSHMTIG
jgi:hypothetical protein